MTVEIGIKLYNLVPRIIGEMDKWEECLDEIKYMGFNHIYINPIYKKGYSKNLYAPQNFFEIDDEFISLDSELSSIEQFKKFIDLAHEKGIKIVLEVILTHTAIDAEILLEHPDWYKYEDGKVKKTFNEDGNNSMEWQDLIELDTENKEVWEYIKKVLIYYLDIGVDGFYIGNACEINMEFIRYLLEEIKKENKKIIFIGDNLGAEISDMEDLARTGIDYMFTSLKWWDMSSIWFIEQHYKLKNLTKLISFPENYGTEQICEKYKLNVNASKIWYTLAALMNSSVMIPVGYEYGSRVKLNELEEWENKKLEVNFDIKEYIKMINEIKDSYDIFNKESNLYIVDSDNKNIFIAKKSLDNREEVLIIINMNFKEKEEIKINKISELFTFKTIKDISPHNRLEFIPQSYHYILNPGEIRIIFSKK